MRASSDLPRRQMRLLRCVRVATINNDSGPGSMFRAPARDLHYGNSGMRITAAGGLRTAASFVILVLHVIVNLRASLQAASAAIPFGPSRLPHGMRHCLATGRKNPGERAIRKEFS